jgi:SNF2 family DNA or RNA helicase
MVKLAKRMQWVCGMTGSPIPRAPTDAWAQCRIITPHTVPDRFTHFRDELMTKDPFNEFLWRSKPDAIERVYRAMQPNVRFTLEDVVELPECIERTQEVGMGPVQAKIYKELKDKCYAAVTSTSGTQEITALNAGAVMMKLLQVACGYVYDKNHNVVSLDNNTRVQAMLDAIASTDRKVLVFMPFKHTLSGVSEALTKAGVDHVTMSGDTSPSQRPGIFNTFQNTSKYKALVAHPKCMSHGVTLTAAATVLWFAPTLSLNIFLQANYRIIRVGQKYKQLILKLQGTPIEKKIYGMLDGHKQVQEALLELFAEGTTAQ